MYYAFANVTLFLFIFLNEIKFKLIHEGLKWLHVTGFLQTELNKPPFTWCSQLRTHQARMSVKVPLSPQTNHPYLKPIYVKVVV